MLQTECEVHILCVLSKEDLVKAVFRCIPESLDCVSRTSTCRSCNDDSTTGLVMSVPSTERRRRQHDSREGRSMTLATRKSETVDHGKDRQVIRLEMTA